jgi:hypothetical protein
MKSSVVVLLSFTAPSTAGFCWDQPEAAWHGCHASVGGQEALSTEQRQNRGAQEKAAIEPSSGAITLLINVAIASSLFVFLNRLMATEHD